MNNFENILAFLAVLEENLEILESKIVESLEKQALVIDSRDMRFQRAHEAEYPSEIVGTLPGIVGFEYYRAMKKKSSAASSKIATRYERASRDITGNGYVDYLGWVENVRNEISEISDFINLVDMTDEDPTIQEVKHWTQMALMHSKRLYQQLGLSNEVDSPDLSYAEARKRQALLKLSLNKRSTKLESAKKRLDMIFGRADIFYGRMAEAYSAGSMDQMIYDQERRNTIFKQQTQIILEEVKESHSERIQIKALSSAGKALPTEAPWLMTHNFDLPSEELEFWRAHDDTPQEFYFKGTHGALPDLSKGDPHSQYLLSLGGEIAGDIEVDPEIKIDGVDLSEHIHNDIDGSKRVHGEDILDGTLKDSVVDGTPPDRPERLNVSRLIADVNRVVTTSSAELQWASNDDMLHELEVRRVPKDQGDLDADSNDLTGIYWHIQSYSRAAANLNSNAIMRIDVPTQSVELYDSLWPIDEDYTRYFDYTYDEQSLVFTAYQGDSALVETNWHGVFTTDAVPPSSREDWKIVDSTDRLHGANEETKVVSYEGNIFSLETGNLAVSRDGGQTWSQDRTFARLLDGETGDFVRLVDSNDVLIDTNTYTYEPYKRIKITPGGTITIYGTGTSLYTEDDGSFFYSDDLGLTWNFYPGDIDLIPSGEYGDRGFWETLRLDDGTIVQNGNPIFWPPEDPKLVTFSRYSLDDGATWTQLTNGRDEYHAYELFQAPNGSAMQLYWDYQYMSLYMLEPARDNWKHVTTFRSDEVLSHPQVDKNTGMIFFLIGKIVDAYWATTDVYIRYSYDNGQTWSSFRIWEEEYAFYCPEGNRPVTLS